MATPYNPFTSSALPHQQERAQQQKANRQANAPSGPKAHPKHIAALVAARKRDRVRVEPTNEGLRHVLKHPNGMGFRAQGSVEWPLDRFTHRRIREGSIRIVEDAAKRKQPEARPPSRGSQQPLRDQRATKPTGE
jgi:hypothetical protein